jgi:transposase-like protein
MAPGRQRDEHKERQWRQWIARWRSSGLSIAAFCAQHDLSTANFYAWRSTLQRRDQQHPPFVAVHLHDEPDPTTTSPLEVVLTDGRVVRVAVGFDATTLRQLLAVLREAPPC